MIIYAARPDYFRRHYYAAFACCRAIRRECAIAICFTPLARCRCDGLLSDADAAMPLAFTPTFYCLRCFADAASPLPVIDDRAEDALMPGALCRDLLFRRHFRHAIADAAAITFDAAIFP
jgi:hypothetical protein